MVSYKVLASLAAAAAMILCPATSEAGAELPPRHFPAPIQQPACPPVAVGKSYNAWDIVLFYVPNRVLDFVDIFRLNIGIGCGWGFNVRATELAQIGYGCYETTRFGMKGRVMPVYEENINEGGVAFLGYVNGCLQRDPTEVGADLHIGVIGAQAAVSLAEAADFITGFIFVDLQQDDLGPNPFD